MRNALGTVAALSIALALSCAPVDDPLSAAGTPTQIALSVEGFENVEGFVTVRGTSTAPAGWRVLVTASGARGRGVDLTENALVAVGEDGRFEHGTLLSFSLPYEVVAEISRAANPEHMDAFGADLKDRAAPDTRVEAAADGSWKLVARAYCRIGTEEQERELIRASLSAIGERIARAERDRAQIEKACAGPQAAAAASAYIAWARIRADKARGLGVLSPVVDPLFGDFDLRVRALWNTLDLAGLAFLAQAIGDETEYGRLESRVARFDRELARAKKEFADLQEKTP